MAKEAKEDDIELAAPPPSGGPWKIVTIAMAGLLLVGVAVGVTLYFTGALSPSEAKTADGADGEAAAGAVEDDPAERKPAIYVGLDPAFTVNFQDAGAARFLQLGVEVLTRKPEVKDALKQHMPAIRNSLVLLFSAQSSEELRTRQGKEKLRDDTLAGIQRVLEAETGAKDTVEAVFFTSFVMQ